MAKYITKRQQQVLDFIIECIRDNGFPPTIAEICQAFGIKSTNAANDHLVSLEKKGYLIRVRKARGITLTDKAAANFYDKRDVTSVPLLGHVAAGSPMMAEENVEGRITLDPAFASNATYCLRVRGDSMIEDGILDGDVIVVDQKREPRKGDVVVALIDGDATVKHFHRAGDRVELRPANASMESIYVPAHEFQSQGVVVALQRRIS